MTRQQYFEMCEQLGSEPIEEEIPVEYDDLPLEVQEALQLYNTLQDSWDYMGGNYIGKDLSYFGTILELYDVHPADRRNLYELIVYIDQLRAKQIQDRKPKK
jgi:hypothetical protein